MKTIVTYCALMVTHILFSQNDTNGRESAINDLIIKYKVTCYMCQTCQDTTYGGYENYPVKICEYVVNDKNGIKKNARVIMLNPDIKLLSEWIVNACITVKGRVLYNVIYKTIEHIIKQSGAQFVISGVVYEDIQNNDGIL